MIVQYNQIITFHDERPRYKKDTQLGKELKGQD